MLINNILFLLYFYFIFFSTLGFGLLFCRVFNISVINLSIGVIGLIGIFFLTFISYFTNIFFSHNFIHNSIILLLGFLLILYQSLKYQIHSKKIFLNSFVISLVFIIGFFLSKNNEDFGYYHFAYISNLTKEKIQFGLANFNSGFGTQSSIFYFSSLLYLPFVDYYLLNLHGLLILILSNIFFLDKFFFNKINNNNFIKILCFLSFVFINLFFWRLAEYGTDRAGQIIVFIIVIILIHNLIKKSYSEDNIKILLVLICYVLTLKSYFLIYIFLLYLIYVKFKNKLRFFYLRNVNLFLILFLFLFLFFFVNIANTGCIIYPLSVTCFSSLPWTVPLDTVSALNNWFELWSKSGATPNFVVTNKNEYLQDFNWVSNWIKTYFFTKVSDTLGGIIFIIIMFLFLFRSNKIKKTSFYPSLVYLYLLLVIFFIVWFNKHPDLRYGGYVLISLLFFIPASIYLSKYNIIYNYNNFKICLVVLLTLFSFNVRNYQRIAAEFNRNDLYVFNNFPFFSKEYLKSEIKFDLLEKPKIILGYKFYIKNN